MTTATLDDVELGEATAGEARTAIASVLRDGSPRAAERIYVALRAWVWKALNGRRRDAELRLWIDVMKRAEAYLEDAHPATAGRIAVLHELVRESVAVADALPVDRLTRKRHVTDILQALQDAPDGRMHRAALRERTGLKDSNLTRLLNMVTASGLVERHVQGKHVVLELTKAGAATAAGTASASTRPAATAPMEGVRLRLGTLQPGRDAVAIGPTEYVLLPVVPAGKPASVDKFAMVRTRTAGQVSDVVVMKRMAVRRARQTPFGQGSGYGPRRFHSSPNRPVTGNDREHTFPGSLGEARMQQNVSDRHDVG